MLFSWNWCLEEEEEKEEEEDGGGLPIRLKKCLFLLLIQVRREERGKGREGEKVCVICWRESFSCPTYF